MNNMNIRSRPGPPKTVIFAIFAFLFLFFIAFFLFNLKKNTRVISGSFTWNSKNDFKKNTKTTKKATKISKEIYIESATGNIKLKQLFKTQISSGKKHDSARPKIYDTKIVYQDNRSENFDIYMYDLSTKKETRITNDSSSQEDPDIYGDKIVYTDSRDGVTNIFMYDLSTKKETRITDDGSHKGNPGIYGDTIIWVDWGPQYLPLYGNIYMYSISTRKKAKITSNSNAVSRPSIFKNKIVWSGNYKKNDLDIIMYDIVTGKETQITADNANQDQPCIFEDKVVWKDLRNDEKGNIYMYDLSAKKETRITNAPKGQEQPVIFDNIIIWVDYRYEWDLFMYNLSSKKEIRISAPASSPVYRPDIHTGTIVWEDYQPDCASEVYSASTYGLLGGFGNSDTGLQASTKQKVKWKFLNFSGNLLSAGQAIKFAAKTSSDGTNWSTPYGRDGKIIDWGGNYFGQSYNDNSPYLGLAKIPASKFIDIIVRIEFDGKNTPVLNSISASYTYTLKR